MLKTEADEIGDSAIDEPRILKYFCRGAVVARQCWDEMETEKGHVQA